jgi:hypothetical protein
MFDTIQNQALEICIGTPKYPNTDALKVKQRHEIILTSILTLVKLLWLLSKQQKEFFDTIYNFNYTARTIPDLPPWVVKPIKLILSLASSVSKREAPLALLAIAKEKLSLIPSNIHVYIQALQNLLKYCRHWYLYHRYPTEDRT